MFQESVMGGHPFAKGRIGDVGNPVILARLPDDFADGRIVDVADTREEVTLDLEVESPGVPLG